MNISKLLLITDFFPRCKELFTMICDLFKLTLLLCKKYSSLDMFKLKAESFARLRHFSTVPFQRFASRRLLLIPFLQHVAQGVIQYVAKS